MNCPFCKNVLGQPIEMVDLYIKNHPSRMNRNQTPDYTPVGYICPLCKHMEKREVLKFP